MGKGKKVTVGYRYFLGLHLIVCRAPIDALLEIVAGDRSAWRGSVTTSGQIYINAPNLFGGEERDGGLQGVLDVMMGEPTQGPNSYLASQQPGVPQPGYRGKLSLVFRRGLVSALNPYIKPWAIRVRRILKGWHNDAPWYPEKAAVEVEPGRFGMNAAHMVYQVLTDPIDGMAYPAGMMGASFTAAADTLHEEGFGLCAAWNRSDTIENFVQEICDHVGGLVVRDPRTGLWEFELLRDNYIAADLPELGPGIIIERQSASRALLSETCNEITVVYRDILVGKDGSVTAHQLANIQAQGGVVSQKQSYGMLPTLDLAKRVAMRDLRVKSAELWRFKWRCNRRAWKIRPGQVFRHTDPDLGIVGIPVRILRVNYGSQRNSDIIIDAAEDIFGLPATTYIGTQPPGWTPPNLDATPPAQFDAYEASYRDLLREGMTAAEIEALPEGGGLVGGVASRASGGTVRNWTLHTATTGDLEAQGSGDFAGTAVLAGTLGLTGNEIVLELANGLDDLEVGDGLLIGGLERARVDAIDGDTLTIGRGAEDTVRRAWASGARVWAIDDDRAADATVYLEGEEVTAAAVTNAAAGPLPLVDAPSEVVEIVGRPRLPYPPGRLRIDGAIAPSSVSGTPTITWAHRSRIVQADQLVDDEAASVTPEAGTRYGVRLLDASDAVLVERLNVDGEACSFVLAYTGDVTLELFAITDVGESWQRHERTFAYTPPPGTTESVITAPTWTPTVVVIDGGEVTA